MYVQLITSFNLQSFLHSSSSPSSPYLPYFKLLLAAPLPSSPSSGLWGRLRGTSLPGKPRGRFPPPPDGNLKKCPKIEKIEKISSQLSSFSQPYKWPEFERIPNPGGGEEFFQWGTQNFRRAPLLKIPHTNLNCNSWYISPGTVHKGPYSIEQESTNYAPLSVNSTTSNVLQITVSPVPFCFVFW